MNSQARYFKIGLFVLAALTLAVVGTTMLGAGTLFEKGLRVETVFDGSVQGLSVGSPVKFRGVTIGEVEKITIAPKIYNTQSRYIVVVMYIPEEGPWFKSQLGAEELIAREVGEGLRVQLAVQGLTGAAYLEVDYKEPKYNPPIRLDWEPEYPYLPSTPSVITRISDFMTRVMRSLEGVDVHGVLENMQATLALINNTLADSNLDEVGQEARNLLEELRKTNSYLAKALDDFNSGRILANLSDTTGSLRNIARDTEKSLPKTLAGLEKAVKALDQLPASLRQLQQTLRRVDRLTADQQRNIEETLENLRRISANIEELTEDTARYPGRVIFGTPPERSRPEK